MKRVVIFSVDAVASVIAVIVVGGALWSACAPALHEPRPVGALAPGKNHGRSADDLLRDADAAWVRRTEPGQAAAAQDLFLDAAAADDHRIEGLLGAMRVMTFRIERETGIAKDELSTRSVEAGQWCQRRAPASAECDYRLAIALGQQAREKKSTGKDALGKIVDLLHKAIAKSPDLESGGPHRVLALVLLRAPSWPVGPGDPEAALAEARLATQRFPDAADNQLVLAEALVANDSREEAHTAYARALALATAAHKTDSIDAPLWIKDAQAGVDRTASP
jgi:hypothetical protein